MQVDCGEYFEYSKDCHTGDVGQLCCGERDSPSYHICLHMNQMTTATFQFKLKQTKHENTNALVFPKYAQSIEKWDAGMDEPVVAKKYMQWFDGDRDSGIGVSEPSDSNKVSVEITMSKSQAVAMGKAEAQLTFRDIWPEFMDKVNQLAEYKRCEILEMTHTTFREVTASSYFQQTLGRDRSFAVRLIEDGSVEKKAENQ